MPHVGQKLLAVVERRVALVLTAVTAAGLLLTVAPGDVAAQVDRRDVPVAAQPQQRFDSGQDIQPIYEGWVRNADGTYTFHFGYLNRNYREQPHVQIGANNFLSPGPADQGQPTYFYPRTQRYQFSVTVPATWDLDRELIWELTHNGSTQYAYAWLQPEWEIDRKNIVSILNLQRGRSNDELLADAAPDVEVTTAHAGVRLPGTAFLTAQVIDDGLPPELPDRPRPAREPSLQRPDGAPDLPDNIPHYTKAMPARNGLSVYWHVYRGPADVDFELAGESEGFDSWQVGYEGDGRTTGTFTTTATFSQPGHYLLRATASDGLLLTSADIEVVVTGAP
jgi:hypothetical protein